MAGETAEAVHKGEVVVSGMRPTAGRLHLGNYFGALKNWVDLQDRYRCFYFIADWHALTTHYQDTRELRENVRQLAIDFLSAGLDPERCTLFVQSHVKEHAELALLFSIITPLGWLERVPTYKEQLRALEGREIATHGFIGYPVLQAADIAIYRASWVPVGEDQAAHLELTREIVRRFNHLYGPHLVEPQALFTEVRVLPGVDGRKMSKSYGNTIPMTATAEELKPLVLSMVTDPARVRRRDPGHPEVCTVYAFHRVFSPADAGGIAEACRRADIGCVECKQRLAATMAEALAPMAERRRQLESKPGWVEEVLAAGAETARREARETMAVVREAMNL
ncbi:MAG: tryptophan--tRNA ligase [Clostridia bacterium]|nr:tryptophan--tRNA ligase [Clostridia bacterium]